MQGDVERRSSRLDRESRPPITAMPTAATAIAALGVLALALALYGAPVPRLSEEFYLPLARHTGDAAFLAQDWTMRGPFGEHWVFNHAFGPLAAAMPLTWFGWIGRLVSWSVLAVLLVRLGGRIGLRPAAAATGIGLWLLANQSLVGSDWMFGTFEAKTVAYCFLVGALLAATRRRVPLTMALLGLTLSFHPGVGIWAATAAGIALLLDPTTRAAAWRWSWLGAALAAPGVVGVLATLRSSSSELERFVVINAIPHHADPFFGGARWPTVQVLVRALTLVGMLAANVTWYRRTVCAPSRSTAAESAAPNPRLPATSSASDATTSATRFLVAFQLILILPVGAAFVARGFGAWTVLMLQPLRLGPLIIPLVFFWQLVQRITALHRAQRGSRTWWRRRSVRLAAGGLVLALVVTSPALAAPRMMTRTIRAWTTTDYEADAFAWIRDNTPPSTRCVVPIDRQDAFAIAERPIVGNWQAIRYDALALWKQRVDALVGGPEISRDPPGPVDELTARRAAYDQLSGPQISAVARRYDANCIVSTTRYSFPIWHQIDDVRIYRVNDRAARSAAP